MKKAKPSRTKGKPNTGPKRPMRPGHRMPSSNDSKVPETAPAANSTPIALAHARASSWRSGSSSRWARHSVNTTITGSASPKQTKMMCQPSDTAICIRAGRRFSAASASTSSS